MADSVTPDDSLPMKVMVSRRDLQFNVVAEPWWVPGILQFYVFLSLAEAKASLNL
jgi:hypothetical protein